MPTRPPKKWFRDCEKGVRESDSKTSDPKAVCGALWYHKMSKRSKKRATRKAERRTGRGRTRRTGCGCSG